jgi:hypothetical protein
MEKHRIQRIQDRCELFILSNDRKELILGDYMPTFTPDPDKVWEINHREDKGILYCTITHNQWKTSITIQRQK